VRETGFDDPQCNLGLMDKKTSFIKINFKKTLLRAAEIVTSFLGSTARLRPWLPPQNPAEFLGGFSTILFFTG
jgi:hypothetical protein